MDEYSKYLATNVLNESHIINYRQLCRALKVHTHLAKQMLYHFHHKQNVKKPRSVHATYLITGTTRPTPAISAKGPQSLVQDQDEFQSSPFPSSLPNPEPIVDMDLEGSEPMEENIPVTTIMLVKEEELEEAKEEFEEISSIFVYSLGPGPLQDIQLLTNCNREVVTKFASEDPLQSYPRLGIITNPNVKRRTDKRPPPALVAKTSSRPSLPAAKAEKETKSNGIKLGKQTKDSGAPLPSLKREKSSLLASFAKTKPPKAKTSGSADASPAEDSPMGGMSEDEVDDTDLHMENSKEDDEKIEIARKAKQAREERLRKMMDDDEEGEEEQEEEDEAMADAPTVDDAVDDSSAIDAKAPVREEKKEEVVVSGGRRRGRRRVMKKVTVKDEDGYLVTKEEPVWESFSEDEPEPKKIKTFGSGTAGKGNKGNTKQGQGNIMSFFKKK